MTSTSRQLSDHIDRSAQEVYDYVANPANLPEWAPGLVGSSVMEREGDSWAFDTAKGRVLLDFVPRNGYGVLDHWVTLPSGGPYYNPMRVTADGDGAEVVFSVRRLAGTSDADFDRDCGLVQADLASIRRVLEQRPR